MDKIIDVDSAGEFIEEIEKRQGILPGRIDADPNNGEAGLARLVLTIIELLRKLLEKQAMRRIDAGSLTEDEIERIGATLMKLENKMQDLKIIFGLGDDDLKLNLGPLGDLL